MGIQLWGVTSTTYTILLPCDDQSFCTLAIGMLMSNSRNSHHRAHKGLPPSCKTGGLSLAIMLVESRKFCEKKIARDDNVMLIRIDRCTRDPCSLPLPFYHPFDGQNACPQASILVPFDTTAKSRSVESVYSRLLGQTS
jgi:hypothetical protein